MCESNIFTLNTFSMRNVSFIVRAIQFYALAIVYLLLNGYLLWVALSFSRFTFFFPVDFVCISWDRYYIVIGIRVYQIDFTLIIAAHTAVSIRVRYFVEIRLSNDTNIDTILFFLMIHKKRTLIKIDEEKEDEQMLLSTSRLDMNCLKYKLNEMK